MPTATLTFNLPEEKPEFDLTNSASNMNSVIHDMAAYLRGLAKYTPKECGCYEEVYKRFSEILDENKVEL